MNRTDLKEALAKEGKKFSGHVTEGSLEAQMIVVEDAIAQALADDSEAYFAAMQAAYVQLKLEPDQPCDEDVK